MVNTALLYGSNMYIGKLSNEDKKALIDKAKYYLVSTKASPVNIIHALDVEFQKEIYQAQTRRLIRDEVTSN